MLLPLLLSGLLLYYSFMGLELRYSDSRLMRDVVNNPELDDSGVAVKESKGSGVRSVGFMELSDAAKDTGRRNFWEGQTAELSGLFAPLSDNQFTLFRRKMTCCASDSVPVKVRIFSKDNLTRYEGLKPAKGAKVIGQVQFRKIKDSDEYVPVLVATDIKPVELGNDVFIRE